MLPPVPVAQEPFAVACRRLGPRLMRDLGLSDVQAAGLLGNLGHETGGFRDLQELAPAVPGSRGGWGLAQWTGPRRVAMEAWCRARGLDPADPEAGYGYLCAELRTAEAPALAALRATTSLAAATEAVWRRYERPGVVAPARRLAWARRALAALRGGPAAPRTGGP
ncbi:phage tail tip lysozyme [Methylobacterium oryzae CBMB20]